MYIKGLIRIYLERESARERDFKEWNWPTVVGLISLKSAG